MAKNKPTTSKKIGVVFTAKQIEFIEEVVETGELGRSKAEVVKQITLKYLTDHRYLE